jgi:hypothetical protein
MEGPISFWGYKEQESNLILPEHDDDDTTWFYRAGIQIITHVNNISIKKCYSWSERERENVPFQEHNQWPVKVNMMNGDKLH